LSSLLDDDRRLLEGLQKALQIAQLSPDDADESSTTISITSSV
jgi:hypothetical protein